MEKKIAKTYEEILRLLSVVIERDFRPCGLGGPLKTILYGLVSKSVDENWTGFMIIVKGVFKAVEQARALSEKHNKDFYHYLNMALERRWIENWVQGFRKSFSKPS